MDVTKPYKFIDKFIGFGAMGVTKPYKFIGSGAWSGAGVRTPVIGQSKQIETTFNLFPGSLPPGGPGQGPDGHLPSKIEGLGSIPARP